MTKPLAQQADLETLLAQLSREPDFDAPELQAYDAADLLLLEHLRERLREDQPGSAGVLHGGLAVIGDRHGASRLEQASLCAAYLPIPPRDRPVCCTVVSLL